MSFRKKLWIVTIVYWAIIIGFSVFATLVWTKWQALFIPLLVLYWKYEVGRWPWQGPPKNNDDNHSS